jgi:tRNA threonylcarbamoyladenosine biosynthesis protein TsaE
MPTITLHDEEAMIALGAYCAQHLPARAVCYLIGDLGAGKTTWMKGILRGLGSTEVLRSPTYPIVQHYQVGDKMLAHFDLYRLNGCDDFLDSGLGDEIDQADYVFIEWPIRAKSCLPPANLEIIFQIALHSHTATFDKVAYDVFELRSYGGDESLW